MYRKININCCLLHTCREPPAHLLLPYVNKLSSDLIYWHSSSFSVAWATLAIRGSGWRKAFRGLLFVNKNVAKNSSAGLHKSIGAFQLNFRLDVIYMKLRLFISDKAHHQSTPTKDSKMLRFCFPCHRWRFRFVKIWFDQIACTCSATTHPVPEDNNHHRSTGREWVPPLSPCGSRTEWVSEWRMEIISWAC